jgi:hypothetical protein
VLDTDIHIENATKKSGIEIVLLHGAKFPYGKKSLLNGIPTTTSGFPMPTFGSPTLSYV